MKIVGVCRVCAGAVEVFSDEDDDYRPDICWDCHKAEYEAAGWKFEHRRLCSCGYFADHKEEPPERCPCGEVWLHPYAAIQSAVAGITDTCTSLRAKIHDELEESR